MTDKEYIAELEKALIFVCDCYIKAKESVTTCREIENNKPSKSYVELWFHFPLIQGTAMWAVEKIAELRTKLGNKEGNKISLGEIFERMHEGRITETEFSDHIKSIVKKEIVNSPAHKGEDLEVDVKI